MSIRLTEVRLRQIIREEIARVSSPPYLKESVASESDMIAAESGLGFYVDCGMFLRNLPIGTNIADTVVGAFGLDEILSDTEAVIIRIGPEVVRIYDSEKEILEEVIAILKTRRVKCSSVKRIKMAGSW